MRILITGGAGFIASHVQDAYLKAGHEVAVVDSLVTGKRENLNPKSKFYELDITNPEIKNVFLEFKPDVLNHHAAQLDVRKSVADPLYDAHVNINGMIRLLEAARSVSVKKVIFSSSGGAIYGEQETFPATESHPIAPASPYGLSKKVGEEYLFLYERLYGIKPAILRYANIYGPRQNPHGEAGVISIFSERLLKKQPMVINGDGGQTRDYVFVGDVVRANLAVLPESIGGVYNIATGVETNVNQIYELLSSFAGGGSCSHGPAKLGEQRRSVLDASKARRELGWIPELKLAEGLRQTWDWFVAQ